MPSHNYDPVPCPYVHLVGMLTEHILQHTLPNGKMIFTKTQLKCVRRQMTVHIHKLEMLIGERGKGGQNGLGSMASFHYVQIIYKIYCSLEIYQKGHHLKKEEKREI